MGSARGVLVGFAAPQNDKPVLTTLYSQPEFNDGREANRLEYLSHIVSPPHQAMSGGGPWENRASIGPQGAAIGASKVTLINLSYLTS